MADPNDFTAKYNTKLSPAQEKAFEAWAKANDRLHDSYDYDMRGAWVDGAGQADNGHFPDTYKKPNHPTFSKESKYSGVDGYTGGEWADLGGGKSTYTASPSVMRFHTPDELQAYFHRVEPDASLILAPVLPTAAGSR